MKPDNLHKKAVKAFTNKPFTQAIDAVIAVALEEAAKCARSYADTPGTFFYTEDGYRAAKYTGSVIAVNIRNMKRKASRK